MSRTHELSWAAGFFDGEGYVTIQRRIHPKGYIGHYLRVGINHVAPEPLIEMQRIFGGRIEKQNPESVSGNRHPRHRWTLSTSQAAEALKQMMPYFRNKQNVASLALDFQQTIQSNKQKLSEEVYAKRELLKDQITKLNSLD